MFDSTGLGIDPIVAEGLEFDSRVGYIGHNVANGLLLLRRFFVAVLHVRQAADVDPTTRHTLRRNTESVKKIDFLKEISL